MTLSSLNISQLIVVFNRFPWALLSSALTTCIVIYFIATEPDTLIGVNLVLAKLATTTMLGVFVFTALGLLKHSVEKGMQLWVLGLGFLGLVAYYYSLPSDMYGFDALVYVYRHIFLILLFLVAILWTPFIQSNLSNVDYWEYVKGVLLALLMTINFTIVIVLGVNVALYAIEVLFGFDIQGKYYFILDVFILGVFSVAYFLSQIPENPLSTKASLPAPRVEKFFTLYVLTPLTGLYFIILYAYTAKILLSTDWPKGVLTWLIVAFSAVAVLTYLFWTHFTTEKTNKYRRWIWLAVFVQTLLLFATITMRITEYSWTENRYMVFLLGVWLLGISLYFLVKKEAKIKWIFVSLSVLMSISQIGPLSAYSVSKNAQTSRLETQLEVLKNMSNAKDAPIKIRYEISEGISYLSNRYGIESLEPIFPKITAEFKVLEKQKKDAEKMLREEDDKVKTSRSKSKEVYKKIQNIFKDKPKYYPLYVTHELGFDFVWSYISNNDNKDKTQNIRLYRGYLEGETYLERDIRGYDYMIRYYGKSYDDDTKLDMTPIVYFENTDVTITFERFLLTIQKGKKGININLDDYIKEILEKHGDRPKYLTQNDLSIKKENEKLKIKIEFHNINKENDMKRRNISFNARILYKFKGEK